MPDHSLAEAPTTDIIDRHYQRLNEIWSGARRQWDLYDSYYFRTYAVWDGESARSKRPGWLRPATPTSIVNNAVDRQLALQPVFHRAPTGTGDEAQQAADRVEKALQAMSIEQSLLEPVLTWKAVGKNLSHLGYAVVEKGLDTTVLQKRAADPVREKDMDDDEWMAVQRLHKHYRRAAMPFRTRVPHPSRILMDPWEKKPSLAIKHHYMLSYQIEDLVRARQALGKKTEHFEVRNNDPFEMFVVDEWQTEYYNAFMLSGFLRSSGSRYTYNANQRRLLFVDRNMWGFVRFGHAFAGFGQEPTLESKVDPKHLAVGILDPVLADLKAQAQQVSSRHNAVIDAAWRPILLQGIGADEVSQQINQGDYVEVPSTEQSIRQMAPPNHPRWMFQHGDELDQDIQRGTLSRQLAGEKVPGVNTVGQQAILIESAGRKFVGISWQMEYLAAVNGSQELQLIDLMDLDITVRGKRIKSSDLDSDYSVSASFNAIDPVIQFQNRQIGMAEVQAGLKSTETFWAEDAMLEDSSGERRRLLEDSIRRNPLIHQELALEIAKEMGIEELAERAMERAKEQQRGQTAPTGPSPNGGGEPDLNQALTGDVLNPNRAGTNRAG